MAHFILTDSTAFLVLAIIAITAQGLLLFLALFEPGLDYKIDKLDTSIETDEFLRMLEALTDAKISECQVEVLTNGENYYEAELAAIRQAQHSVHLEAYIFQRGKVADEYLAALAERARAGVQVRLVIDAVGSFTTTTGYVKELLDAGGRVAYYQPLRWYTWPRFNNRTHRELVVIDGQIGFIGGAGVADHWRYQQKGKPRWRDTMCRVTGDAVAGLQSTFIENWLEATGELIVGKEYFPFSQSEQRLPAMVITSAPSFGRMTRARVLFQTLMAGAQKSIYITSPYFLPDCSVRGELVKAMKERGVEVKIIVPGNQTDHQVTRRSGRRLFGDLLEAGAKIYEYQPAMIHAKILIVDDLWSVVGSTNFDNRSFRLNDEVNLAVRDVALSQRLTEDFLNDVAHSKLITYEDWKRRSIFERLHETCGRLIERQQ